jgi:hypothetical protein
MTTAANRFSETCRGVAIVFLWFTHSSACLLLAHVCVHSSAHEFWTADGWPWTPSMLDRWAVLGRPSRKTRPICSP